MERMSRGSIFWYGLFVHLERFRKSKYTSSPYCPDQQQIQFNTKRPQECCFKNFEIKGSSDSSHFIFEISVGKSRIRHRTTLNLNNAIFNRFWVDLEIKFQSRSMSDPPLSDINFKNKMARVWTTLKISFFFFYQKSLFFGESL